ncbi:MAG: DUF6580 family putative transport protein, partial [Candidatus Omnitrophota bacterium]
AWYPHTWEGLSFCYVSAIPFFRNTLLGNLFFALVLFGSYELAKKIVGQTRFRAVLLTD